MKEIKNNSLRASDVSRTVTLYGWVQKKRDLGGVCFIDLRDRSGIVQLVARGGEVYEVASGLKSESVLKAEGTVVMRESKNPNLDTGDIEVELSSLEVLNSSRDLPFEITDDTTALEDTRLKYRYLDIRRNEIKNNLITRHKIMMAARNFLDQEDFIEIETPILNPSFPSSTISIRGTIKYVSRIRYATIRLLSLLSLPTSLKTSCFLPPKTSVLFPFDLYKSTRILYA